MGAVYPAICGQVLCGQTLAGTWRATWERPQLVLNSASFSISITEGPLLQLGVNRPKLVLLAKAVAKRNDTSLVLGKAKLLLLGRPVDLPPFIVQQLARPRLELRARPLVLGSSSQLSVNRPLLILLGRKLGRVGLPGLFPTVPGEVTLTPTVPAAEATLTPTAAEPGLLTPTEVIVR